MRGLRSLLLIAIETLSEDPLFCGLPNLWHALACHYDEVIAAPSPWKLLGRTPACSIHVIRYGDAPIWRCNRIPKSHLVMARCFFRSRGCPAGETGGEICGALRQRSRDDRIVGVLVRRFLSRRHLLPIGADGGTRVGRMAPAFGCGEVLVAGTRRHRAAVGEGENGGVDGVCGSGVRTA